MAKLFVFGFLILLNMGAYAGVQTDMYTYIVSQHDDKVLAIDRRTGEEKVIPVGGCPISLELHGKVGYVINKNTAEISQLNLTKNKVTKIRHLGLTPVSMRIHGERGYIFGYSSQSIKVIDLNTGRFVQTLELGHYPGSMTIYGDFAYFSSFFPHGIQVIDLKSNVKVQFIETGRFPRSMTIYDHFGYVLNVDSNTVTVLDLNTNHVVKTIAVGEGPHFMVIHGDRGYVLNRNPFNIFTTESSDTIHVLDLKTNAVIQVIDTDKYPNTMICHGNFGYVVHNSASLIASTPGIISIINLETNEVTKTIPVGNHPVHMKIHGDVGYVVHESSRYISVINLKTHKLMGTVPNLEVLDVDFSDNHVYLGVIKWGPFCPTEVSVRKMKTDNRLNDFVTMNPEAFNLGTISKRLYPKEENQFDTLPIYVLDHLIWDNDQCEFVMEPLDVLAMLMTMKYPQKFLQSVPGALIRNALHTAFFQAVWFNENEKAKAMLTYFVQLQDPIMVKLATYELETPPERENPSSLTSVNKRRKK